MSESNTTQSELAAQIVTALVSQKLISADHQEQVLQKITSGKATPDDWSLWVDVATEKEVPHD